MLKPRRTLIVLGLSAFLALGFALETAAQDRSSRRARSHEVIESLELFGKVYERIARNYVDEIDPRDLIEAAIDGMLEDLDPHTQLLADQVYDDLMISTQGEFGGLGIQITVRDGYPTVISPIDDTPAFRLGIQGGDQIVEIEGESTKDWRSSDAVKKLRGPKGTSVTIGIRRPGEEKILPFTITRDIIRIESVPYAMMLDDEIGYIRISNFARTTAEELQEKISTLEDQGMQKLLLDLRFNPGGLLQAAKEVSELFLEKEDLIVYTKGRLAQQNMSYYATGRYGLRWKDRPMLVLINGSSASASEILAGAIQDHDVGLVAGKTSFGKGSVQTVFELTETEALKLTTAKYYTPSGRSIHKDRTRDGEPVDHPDELAQSEDPEDPEPQEREVFYTDMGREVYGGGGISPDLDLEPSLLSDFAVALERDATFFEYTNQFVTQRGEVPIEFEVTDAMLDDFYELAQTRERLPEYFADVDLEMTREAFDENVDYIREGIRREVVRRLYGSNEAFRVSLERDGQVWEAVDILREADEPGDLFRIAEEMKQKRLAEAAAKKDDAEALVH